MLILDLRFKKFRYIRVIIVRRDSISDDGSYTGTPLASDSDEEKYANLDTNFRNQALDIDDRQTIERIYSDPCQGIYNKFHQSPDKTRFRSTFEFVYILLF